MLNYIQKRILFYFVAAAAIVVIINVIAYRMRFATFQGKLGLTLLVIGLSYVFLEALRRFKKWGNGDIGEADVRRVLNTLPNDFKVVPDVNLGHENIDFLVVGPTGVWIVEVKGHERPNVGFNGKELTNYGKPFEKDFLSQVWRQVYKLQSIFQEQKLPVKYFEPVIVFAGPYSKIRFGYRKPRGIRVIGLSWLHDLITKGFVTKLSQSEIELINSKLQSLKA